MPYTAQKPAGKGKTLALALREVLFVLSWGLLGGAVLLPFTRYWFAGIPPALLIAVYALAYSETLGRNGPLRGLELRQYSSQRKRNVSLKATFFRILLNTLLLPPLLAGFVTLLSGRRSIPELITGIRLTETDRRLDTRPRSEIERTVKAARTRLRTLIMAPLAASAAMFVLNYSAPEVINVEYQPVENVLPEYERELLAQYLELTALHPDELEYHVRLASLYYRNGMRQDLMGELELISRIDPEHAILLLGDSTRFDFHMLESQADTMPPDSTITLEMPAASSLQDSAGTDTLQADTLQADSLQTDTLTVRPDTASMVQDTLAPVPADTLQPEPPQAQSDTLEIPEETVEPDTLVQP